jgi:hypothetical protein
MTAHTDAMMENRSINIMRPTEKWIRVCLWSIVIWPILMMKVLSAHPESCHSDWKEDGGRYFFQSLSYAILHSWTSVYLLAWLVLGCPSDIYFYLGIALHSIIGALIMSIATPLSPLIHPWAYYMVYPPSAQQTDVQTTQPSTDMPQTMHAIYSIDGAIEEGDEEEEDSRPEDQEHYGPSLSLETDTESLQPSNDSDSSKGILCA